MRNASNLVAAARPVCANEHQKLDMLAKTLVCPVPWMLVMETSNGLSNKLGIIISIEASFVKCCMHTDR